MDPPNVDPVLSDRIKSIVGTEKQIDDMMKCAKEIIYDLAKEKQISKNKMEENASTFKKLITQVENELSSQMQYLSHVCVGSSHQGSTFGTLQNSLLAQVGCSALHSELGDILSGIMPPPPTPETTETTETTETESYRALTTQSLAFSDDLRLQEPGSVVTEASGPRSQEEPERMEE